MAHTCPICGESCTGCTEHGDDVENCLHCGWEHLVFDGMAAAFGHDLDVEMVRFWNALKRRHFRRWARNHGRRWVQVRAQVGGGRKPWW